MTPAYDHYAKLTDRSFSEGKFARMAESAENDYDKKKLPTIPKCTIIKIEFAGDFGCYALADVNGALHKIKILLPDLHKIEFILADPQKDAQP